jgi:hypothetical protein
MYNRKLHETKNWQVIGFTCVSIGSCIGSFFLPIKPGEIPVARLAMIAISGGTLVAGGVVEWSKQELDRQRAVLEASKTKIFVQGVAMDTALELETARTRCENSLAKEAGVEEDVNHN